MAKTSRRLGARFYFARGQTERNARCILEISRQLASLSERMLRDSIVMAIQEDPDIITSPAVLQYQKLILEPLLTLVDTDLKLIIVIDAVDECEEEYATKLLELIGRDHHRLPIGVKFFVTSRVEPHIQSELEDESVFPTVEQLSLDEEGSSTVQKDIVLYLKGRLPALVKKFGIKDKDWPGEPARMELARMAGESFIWAATAVLLVADPNYRNPVARLEHILSTPSLKNLDYLYSSALSHAFPSIIDQPVLSLLRDMLGMLVVARTPLSLVTLASLMSSTTDSPQVMAEKIREQILNYLGSVLTVSDGDNVGNSKPIQFLHKSFVDFLTTKGRCDDRFLLHIPEQHEKMASRCLQRLNGLERNICQLTDPSKLNSEVSDLNERIHRHIPYALQYASEHWADHITKITVDRGVKTEIDLLFEVFMARVLLFWIELMGLLGKAKEAVLLVRLAETWVTARGKRINFDPSLLPLVRDAKRFIMGFMEPISTSSLHIYISALAFTPTNSHLLATYGNLLTAGPKLLRCHDAEWSSCLWAGSKHSGYVTCLAVTPDGRTIASGSHDRALRLWDVRTGAPIGGPLHGHTGGVTCVSWSPNGKVLLSGSDDNTLRLWDGEIGVTIGGALVDHTGGITCLSWASDGKRLVSASTDGTLRLWDADTGGDIVTLEGHNGGVTCLAFSTDGQTVVSGSEDWTLTLWDVATSKAIHQLKGHEDKINCLAWPPNGKILASGSADHTLRLWNTETGSSVKKLEQSDEVNCLAFSPNGKTLGFAVGNSGLFLLDAETGADVGEPLKGHTDKITCLRFSPDSKVLASGSRDETLRLWDTATGLAIGGALEGHSDEINCLAFAPNSKTLASGADDYTLRLWDLNTEVPVQEPSDNLALVWCLAFAPGGKTLVTGSMDSTIRFLNVETGTPLGEPLIGHTDTVTCLAFFRSGTALVSGSDDHTLRFWNVATGTSIGEPLRCHAGFTHLALSPSGRMIASGSSDGTVHLWDADALAAIGEALTGHSCKVTCLTWSPNGRTFASGAEDGTVSLWDADSGNIVGTMQRGHSDSISCAVFRPDGRILISGSDDYTLRLWDATTGIAIGKALEGHSKEVTRVAFTPDGKFLISIDAAQHNLVRDATSWALVSHRKTKDLTRLSGDSEFSWGIDRSGWVWNGKNRRLFWLPAGLRGWGTQNVILNRTTLAIGNARVPLVDVSVYVVSDAI
ncbi:hypothetical protein FRB95_003652 [Tulasnella sp. JGI-2019a]|nr:hypothetical protein FRB95_003652 [Tulasnella sp. JGI-2019a]